MVLVSKRSIIHLVFLTLLAEKYSIAHNHVKPIHIAVENLLNPTRYVDNCEPKENKINEASIDQPFFSIEEVQAFLDKFSVSKVTDNPNVHQSGGEMLTSLSIKDFQKWDSPKRNRPFYQVLGALLVDLDKLGLSYTSIAQMKLIMANYRCAARKRFQPNDLVPDRLHTKMNELQQQYSEQLSKSSKDKIREEMVSLAMFDPVIVADFRRRMVLMKVKLYEQEMELVGPPPYCKVEIEPSERGFRPTRENFLKFPDGSESFSEKVLDREGLWEEINKWEQYYQECNYQEKGKAKLRIQVLKLKDPYVTLSVKREEALQKVKKYENEMEQAEAMHPLNEVVQKFENREFVGGNSWQTDKTTHRSESKFMPMDFAKEYASSACEVALEKQELFWEEDYGYVSASTCLELADAEVRHNSRIKTILANEFSKKRKPLGLKRANHHSQPLEGAGAHLSTGNQ